MPSRKHVRKVQQKSAIPARSSDPLHPDNRHNLHLTPMGTNAVLKSAIADNEVLRTMLVDPEAQHFHLFTKTVDAFARDKPLLAQYLNDHDARALAKWTWEVCNIMVESQMRSKCAALPYYVAHKRSEWFTTSFRIVLESACYSTQARMRCVRRCVVAAIVNVKRDCGARPSLPVRVLDVPRPCVEDDKQRARRARAERERERRRQQAFVPLDSAAEAKEPQVAEARVDPARVVEDATFKEARVRAARIACAAHLRELRLQEEARVDELEWRARMVFKGYRIGRGE